MDWEVKQIFHFTKQRVNNFLYFYVKIQYYLFFLLILFGCDNFNEPKSPDNTRPVINKIVIDPSAPNINQVVKLTAYIYDADKDQLYVSWSVSGGALTNNSYGNPIYWSTPDEEGYYTIICILTDGIENDTKNIAVKVSNLSEPIEPDI